jgi:hypothetical protein
VVTIEVVEGFMRDQYPFTFCIPCMAKQLGAREHDIRESAQLMVLQTRFALEKHVCFACDKFTDTMEIRREAS